MGPLIFVARKHQIQRKKSQLNMRLMQIQNQREKIAEQIGQAQQAKTARQNLFNSTSRMAQNSIMAMMNIQNMANNYSSNMGMQLGLLNAQKQASAFSGLTSLSGITPEKYNELTGIGFSPEIFRENTQDGKTTYSIANAEKYNEQVQNYYNQKVQSVLAPYQANQLSSMANNIAMNGMMGASNLFNNLINTVSNLGDEAELESLNAIDSQLEQEQTTVETQLKMLEAELQSVDKQLDNEIKQSAPKFGLSG